MDKMRDLQKKQYELDKFIYKENGIIDVKDIELDKIIALDVELSEFMNEVKSFKYWKKNKEIDRVKVIEEASDCLHFILSLANDNNVDMAITNVISMTDDINMAYRVVKACLWEGVYLDNKWSYLKNMLRGVIIILEELGFTYDDLMKAYNKKYEINIKRQMEGY